MRILHWVSHYHPDMGGLEVFTKALLPALAARGHEQVVVASHGSHDLPDRMRVDGIEVVRFPFGTTFGKKDLATMIRLKRAIAALHKEVAPDFDHVHFAGLVSSMYTLVDSKAPLLVTLHSVVKDLPRGPESTTERLLSRARWVTAVSRATLAEACERDPSVARKSSVILNGLDYDITPGPWPEGPLHVVTFGRLVPEKGFDAAIDAVAKLPPELGARLTIAGDGPERAALVARGAPLGERVSVPGWVSREALPALLASAHVVLVPSRWQEPFGLVALEGALAARPVVATRAGGLPEVVKDGETGVIVPMDDSDAMARAILALVKDPARARALGAAGRARALAELTLAPCVAAYDTLYRERFGAGGAA